LGGLGEIGMNCLAIEQSDGILVVDCGTAFPFDDHGIDVYHPDLTWLIERAERVSGIFLTHGHEDHIGGLPYLLQHFDAPIYGPAHALGLVRLRLAEHDIEIDDVELITATTGKTYPVGPFAIEPMRVAHSTIQATALRIQTRAGVVFHSGDFNLDPDPPDGEPTDIARMTEIGDDGVALMLSDSTNVDSEERAGSERSVGTALDRLADETPGRLFVALFASNIQRLILIGEMALRTGRKICLLGRSLSTQVALAQSLGHLRWPSDLRIAPEQAAGVPPHELLFLAGGTQAERNSAMMRLAKGTHSALTLERGDTVIFSSRIIPGNERPVLDMFNDILRRGVTLHTWFSHPAVHTSGHAGRSEQRRLIDLIRPRMFLPIHGTLHHLLRHGELAKQLGVEHVAVVENGTSVVARSDGLFVDEQFNHEKQAVSLSHETLSPDILRKRSEIGRAGVAFVALTLDRDDTIVAGPQVTTVGVPGVDADELALRAVRRELGTLLRRFRRFDGDALAEQIRRATRRALYDLSGARPTVQVQLMRLDRGAR
jgi:ribonuclease J